ncbi:fimbria/pilus periplasmic chaperone [Providencia stuartii]|nr:molecular chaperone [Providencia stuartii]MTB79066.1 fimbria/pilus periplasmic chaperone [Providencia stuartii]
MKSTYFCVVNLMKLSGMLLVIMSLAFCGGIQQVLAHEGGIVLGSTRVIYPESALKGVTFNLTNHTPWVYLLQSRITPWSREDMAEVSNTDLIEGDEKDNPPFIILPPLTRFEPEQTLALRIRLTRQQLPTDRESVFMLMLKAIPSQPSDIQQQNSQAKATLVLALQNNIKLFYRPSQLPMMDASSRAEQLQFIFHKREITVKNSSAYFVTLNQLSVGGDKVNLAGRAMIAPFSQETYMTSESIAKTVDWQIFDDEGRPTPKLQRLLH